MNAKERKQEFERHSIKEAGFILSFEGVDGFDVYNCSQPFFHQNKWYLFGRVERRTEWMRSWVQLFEKNGENSWKLVPNSMIYQLEDPYIAMISNQIVMGGTHVQVKQEDELSAYFGYFYYGKALDNLKYFTTGPKNMKDIRIVQLADGRIGVFSRPRDKTLIKKYGCESMIGFTIIDKLTDLTAENIANAQVIPNLFGDMEWGGVNHAYLLDSGKIGIIGHLSYEENGQSIYTVMSFVFEPTTLEVFDYKIIATRNSFPSGPPKREHLLDCCFPSGIICVDDTYCDLYSGLGDTQEGVTKIPYPFKGFGKIIENTLTFNN